MKNYHNAKEVKRWRDGQRQQTGKGEDSEFTDREQCPSEMIVASSSREQGEQSSLAHPE